MRKSPPAANVIRIHMAAGVCLGLALGLLFGFAKDVVPLGLVLGVCLGMLGGGALAYTRKRA